MRASPPERLELDLQELEAILERAQGILSESEVQKLDAALQTLAFVTRELEAKRLTLQRLRKILFGASTEKTRQVFDDPPARPGADDDSEPASTEAPADPAADDAAADDARPKRPGHGRHGAADYEGAHKITVRHESLASGDRCPACGRGKLYELPVPAVLVRVTGQPPLPATVAECQRLRCNLCGEVWTASAPPELGEHKYDEKAAAMIGLLRYGIGLPWYRLEQLEGYCGIPLPASTQWDIVRDASAALAPAHEHLLVEAAQGQVVYNDDTPMKILALTGKRRAPPSEEDSCDRTGVFTSGIVSTREGRRIALYFTGHQHAGENLADVLAARAAELGPPIQMCDALSRNFSVDHTTIVASCLAHARRRFVDVASNFPDECRHVLETLAEVYHHDATCRERQLSPDERLRFHQQHSKPLLDDLEAWLQQLLDDKKVEPNSGLGEAIGYMLKHYPELTLFLRRAGAPLDNNIAERALKRAILHRKNSLFYKTENGARVGDMYMSLIHTAELNHVDPFDYLVALQQHATAVRAAPADWMPWTYQPTRAALTADT